MAVSLLRRAFVCAVGAALAWALACVARVPVTSGTTTVTPLWFDPTAAVNQVDERFLSVTMDWHLPSEEWPAWGNASVLNANLQSALLRRLARALGPAFLRIGGSEADMVIYDVGQAGDPCNGTDFCLNMSRWGQINAFAQDAGLNIVFGINGMYGRKNSTTPWDPSNAILFLQHTAEMGYTNLAGFELGNELTTKVNPRVIGADFNRLRVLVDKLWTDPRSRPLIIGPDENPNTGYLSQFLSECAASLDAVTWHLYIGYGLNPNLTNQLQDPLFLDQERQQAVPIQETVAKYAPHAQVWVGESAAAWHSGRNLTTNAFISSIWYTDQAGTLAQVGGWYGLLNWTNLHPNPDYFTALVWKKVMGTRVLQTAVQGDPRIRFYAHCQYNSTGGVTMLVINLHNSSFVEVDFMGLAKPNLAPREEYRLSAPHTYSQIMQLNGRPLMLVDGSPPPLTPYVETSAHRTAVVAPLTVNFFVFPNANVLACQQPS